MQEYFWEAMLINGCTLHENIHSFHSVTKDNLARLMLNGKNLIYFTMDGIIHLNYLPFQLKLNDRDLFGRPEAILNYKDVEAFLGTGNYITQYNIGYERSLEDCHARFLFSLPVKAPGFLQVELTPRRDLLGSLLLSYNGQELAVPTCLESNKTWRIQFEIHIRG